MSDLEPINYGQVSKNLRRTASKDAISLLYLSQLNRLALSYYGIYENGSLVGYQCPYSGEVLTDSGKIVLEHIIPCSSGGGTILFNCVPTSSKVNGTNEKGARHLLEWWREKEYYSADKLAKLLAYIFEAYDNVFFRKNALLEISLDSNQQTPQTSKILEADLSVSAKEQARILKEQAQRTGKITYIGFINDCINELKILGYDTTSFEQRLERYKENGVFDKIDRYTLFQNTLKEVIKSKLGTNNRSDLTYLLRASIRDLMKSMPEFVTKEAIREELLRRINNIENLLKPHGITLLSFFEDLNRQSILYKRISEITKGDIDLLIKTIRLCPDNRFDLFAKTGGIPLKGNNEINRFRKNIVKVKRDGKGFETPLSKEQLERLRNSTNPNLNQIYIEILNKAIEHGIHIAYIDEGMQRRIFEYKAGLKKDLPLADKINLQREYQDVIISNSLFNKLVIFVMDNNRLPSLENPNEKDLAKFVSSLLTTKNKKYFELGLTEEQLTYLHDSNLEILRDLYAKMIKAAQVIQYKVYLDIDERIKTKGNTLC